MIDEVKKIVIVGGGTAGWLTAARIAKKHSNKKHQPVSVTLIESPNIKTIGVGEGTWPTLRETLEAIGISESDFIRECSATFKQGAQFVSWTRNDASEAYFHPFNLPIGLSSMGLAPYWIEGVCQDKKAFADTVDHQARLSCQGLAPKAITTPEYRAINNYAYHLDTHRLGEFLKKHSVDNLGVKHLVGDVTKVNLDEDGYIKSLDVKDTDRLAGDLFIDCTGARSLLLGQAMEVSFKSCQDTLFVDTAIAAQLPHDQEDQEIACHTISTAQSSGWIWNIGLQHRCGIGHVFSSSHTTSEQAERELRDYIDGITKGASKDLSYRQLKIHNGYRETPWVKNCVGVGLAAGFVEPLEASAIMLLESYAKFIAERLPHDRESMEQISISFNNTMKHRWERIIDFLKLHYAITKRTDSEFWIDNANPRTIPQSLQERLQLWKKMPPNEFDFINTSDVFPAASYQYVLFGMNFDCDYRYIVGDEDAHSKARRYFKQTQQMYLRQQQQLPGHRSLIQSVCQHGMQVI